MNEVPLDMEMVRDHGWWVRKNYSAQDWSLINAVYREDEYGLQAINCLRDDEAVAEAFVGPLDGRGRGLGLEVLRDDREFREVDVDERTRRHGIEGRHVAHSPSPTSST